MQPRFPVFVPSKGRADSRLTQKMLTEMGVPYRTVIEPQEVKSYIRAGEPEANILVLPHRDKGLVVTRNWIWSFALEEGYPYLWTIDDNVWKSYRLTNNQKTPVADGTMFYVMEEFALRYSNLPIVGANYYMFAPRKAAVHVPPLFLNNRIYSNMLLAADFRDPRGNPYRNEGWYNDDTDLCLRVLKDGNCTVLFNAFLIQKMTTMHVKGGMTAHYEKQADVDPKWRALAEEAVRRHWYFDPADEKVDEERVRDGRWRMAVELAAKHPDVTKITHKFGRWQHQVDYSPFRRNKLILREGVKVPEGTNEFGMILERRDASGTWAQVDSMWYPWEDSG